jgi:hypothetical protein
VVSKARGVLGLPPLARDLLMRSHDQIPAGPGVEIADDGRFNVDTGFHVLILIATGPVVLGLLLPC